MVSVSAINSNIQPYQQLIIKGGDKAKENVVYGEGPNPEDVNKAANAANDRANEIRGYQESAQALRREMAADVYQLDHKQHLIDIYIEASEDAYDYGKSSSIPAHLEQGISDDPYAMSKRIADGDFEAIKDSAVQRKKDALEEYLEGIQLPYEPELELMNVDYYA